MTAVLRTMPVGVMVERGEEACWSNAELARIWRYHETVAPSARALRMDLAPATGGEGADDLLRSAFGASIAGGRWRPHLLRRRDGTVIPVRVARKTIRGSGGLFDVTYVTETARRQPDARLRQAFLAMIGHELRTPISSVVAGAELLQDAALEERLREEVTGLVVEEAHRLNMLVEQLTALTQLQGHGSTPALEPVHMLHLVRKVCAREARRRPALRVLLPRLHPDAPIALGDEGLIAQVLSILIDNAGKYAATSAEVEVEVRREGDEIEVRVLDRGPGLQGADPGTLFQLFERAPAHASDGRGTGIGLYVASQIVAVMQGRIWGADRPGGGADFGFALPATS